MKINKVTTSIAIAISVLISYGFYAFWRGETYNTLHFATIIISLLFLVLTLTSAIGISFKTSRITIIIRSVAGMFFLIGFVLLILLANFSSSLPFLVILMGGLTLIFVLIVYAVSKSRQ